jgi:glucoamylase
MVNSATALLAAGDKATPLRALIFLAVSQHEDGGFAQNFWVNGDAYWTGIQLDEVAFPIILAWRLYREKALEDFDPYTSIRKAAAYLIRHGPVTQQERWEEASGYSPSTLASNIAALSARRYFSVRKAMKRQPPSRSSMRTTWSLTSKTGPSLTRDLSIPELKNTTCASCPKTWEIE